MRFTTTHLFSLIVAAITAVLALFARTTTRQRGAVQRSGYPSLETHDYLPDRTAESYEDS